MPVIPIMSSDKAIMALTLIFCCSVTIGYEFKSSHLNMFNSYSLAEYSTKFATDSAVDCAVNCIAKNTSGCVAHEWDAEIGSCFMQDKLNVTKSDGKTIGVMIKDCSEILHADPSSQSGVYALPVGTDEIRPVWCDMDTDGGGWTVFLKRLDGSVDFSQDLASYKQGFGNVSGEHWLGLDALHFLTSTKTYQLRVDISDWDGESVFALYEAMVVGDEANNYTLVFEKYLGGDAGNGLYSNNGEQFTTHDADRDSKTGMNCAQSDFGGFWYRQCSRAYPTAKYYAGGSYIGGPWNGIQWRTWSKHDYRGYSMKTISMKFRP